MQRPLIRSAAAVAAVPAVLLALSACGSSHVGAGPTYARADATVTTGTTTTSTAATGPATTGPATTGPATTGAATTGTATAGITTVTSAPACVRTRTSVQCSPGFPPALAVACARSRGAIGPPTTSLLVSPLPKAERARLLAQLHAAHAVRPGQFRGVVVTGRAGKGALLKATRLSGGVTLARPLRAVTVVHLLRAVRGGKLGPGGEVIRVLRPAKAGTLVPGVRVIRVLKGRPMTAAVPLRLLALPVPCGGSSVVSGAPRVETVTVTAPAPSPAKTVTVTVGTVTAPAVTVTSAAKTVTVSSPAHTVTVTSPAKTVTETVTAPSKTVR